MRLRDDLNQEVEQLTI